MKLTSHSFGRLSPERMYALLLASDPTYNGRFFTGVLTTGVYCLPSCKARKPKRDHVRFFPNVQAARAAGLRPCKKCYPDDFARGADPVLESIETLVAELRAHPAAFPDTSAIVRRSGFGATRLFELFRLHYQATPAELLLRTRLDGAKQTLLGGNATIDTIAADAGFDALSAFHENFRRRTGLTPAAYRQLRSTREFELRLPPGYPLPYLRRALSRDTASVIERLAEDVYTTAVRLTDGPAQITLHLSPTAVRAELSHGSAAEAHGLVAGLLGLGQDAAGFARLARRLGLARLTHGREELRVSQTHSVWDGLLWSIIGQQINFAFACVLRRRLTERAGTPVNDGLCALPDAAAVAELSRADLLKLQFSRQKAEYTLALARAVLEGKLEPDGLQAFSATRAERTLLAVHGLGPWSVNYVMMRSLGFADCVPLGDTGVGSGLQALFNLEERPEIAATRRLMAVFSPYRSLATAHLWQFKQAIPA
jgi:AraC family transcriptional regulator, regulatory protein of adaptative response / DNA-3-methyladenine glycosylase II